MPSLKSVLPNLAPIFGLTASALYERQRALVRMELLQTPIGRGPGAGAEATPKTVALMAIACLVSDNLSDVDVRVRDIANAPYRSRSSKRRTCFMTAAATFLEALTIILDREEPPSEFLVSVYRVEQRATLVRIPYDRSVKSSSEFGQPRDIVPGVMQVKARLDPWALTEVWNALGDYRNQ